MLDSTCPTGPEHMACTRRSKGRSSVPFYPEKTMPLFRANDPPIYQPWATPKDRMHRHICGHRSSAGGLKSQQLDLRRVVILPQRFAAAEVGGKVLFVGVGKHRDYRR